MWYGTYHSGVNFTEGSLQLVGPSISTTVAFTMLVTTKPSGLIDGTTNFYSNAAGTALTGTPVPIAHNGGSFNGLASSVLAWQGVQFTGITKPGTYTFTYIPIAVPTVEWDPINNAILTATFTLSAQALGLTFTSLLPPGSPTNVLNVAAALDNSVANGGTLPAGLQNLYNLTPAQLSAAMSALSGEAATDSEKGAFALMNQFLGLMLDPFVDGRDCGEGLGLPRDPLLGRPDCSGGQRMGLAPEQQAHFPPNLALAYASVLKAPPMQPFDQRWSAWGASFGASSTGSGNAVVGSTNVTARDYGFASGIDYHVSPTTLAGFALAGSGTNWGLAQGLGGGRSDAFQVGIYGKSYYWSGLCCGSLCLHQQLVHHQPPRPRRSAHRKVQRRKLWGSAGGRLPFSRAIKRRSVRDVSLRRGSGPVVPYAALQRDRSWRGRARAERQRRQCERHPQRIGRALRRYDRGQRHAADPACAARLGP